MLLCPAKLENVFLQGVQSPEGMKFPDFSLAFPDYDYILMCVQDYLGGSGGMFPPQKMLKITMLRLTENEFTQQNSLTFLLVSKFSDIICPGFPGHWTPCLEILCIPGSVNFLLQL